MPPSGGNVIVLSLFSTSKKEGGYNKREKLGTEGDTKWFTIIYRYLIIKSGKTKTLLTIFDHKCILAFDLDRQSHLIECKVIIYWKFG